MSEMTLEKLKGWSSKERYSNGYYRKVYDLIETLSESGILQTLDKGHVFYPQNIFLEEEDIEFLFISERYISICNIDEQGDVHVQTLSLKEINKVELLKLNPEKRTAELIVYINNEEPIILSNEKDTNEHWGRKFYDLILEIYSVLKVK
ncbi:TPA: DUF3908 family protein [Bacillus cereus]|uniref:DUF3908 family protein n=1 Tax=Bacillus thuringiensis TaxID=1428 RepID=UPI000BF5AF5A|nr:DUF3908 family protein [Bacillus thuringiensis]PEZ31995.1 hypothetical protein CN346_19090 [Bacillus thuringiensis]HDR6265247.1 DUF3908 family protein [Bacillus cereus]